MLKEYQAVQADSERPQPSLYELSELLQKHKDRIALTWEHGTLQIDDVVHVPDENGILIYVDCISNQADLTS